MDTSAPIAAPAASAPSSEPKQSDQAENSSEPREIDHKEPSKEPKAASAPKKEGEKDSAEPKETKEEKEVRKEAERRKYKLKVNGKEVEKEYSDDEVSRKLQLIEAADERFQKASETEKQLQNFVKALKEDPFAVLSQLGLDDHIDALAEKRLTSKVQRDLMTPEEREIAELREFKSSSERAKQEAEANEKTSTEKQQFEEYRQRASQHYDTQITDALTKSSLPKTPYTVKRVAEVMANALNRGYELDAQTAADMVHENYLGDVQAIFGQLDAEKIIKILGPDLAKKIRKYDVDNLRAKMQTNQPAEQVEKLMSNSPSEPRRDQKKYMREDEWKEMIRKRAGL